MAVFLWYLIWNYSNIWIFNHTLDDIHQMSLFLKILKMKMSITVQKKIHIVQDSPNKIYQPGISLLLSSIWRTSITIESFVHSFKFKRNSRHYPLESAYSTDLAEIPKTAHFLTLTLWFYIVWKERPFIVTFQQG